MRLKYFLAVATTASLGLMMSSCADDPKTDITVDKPTDVSDYEYLKAYGVIKDYCQANVGASVDAALYNEGGDMATLINSNFDEVVASYHMKHGGVVKDDGSMDFSVVDKFLENTAAAGINVYGHTLCWHSGQNVAYLNSLLEDKWVDEDGTPAEAPKRLTNYRMGHTPASFVASRVEEAEWGDNILLNGDFEGEDGGSFFTANNGTGATGVITAGAGSDGVGSALFLSNPAAGKNWNAQFGIQFPDFAFAEGEVWLLSFDVKSNNSTPFSGTHVQTAAGAITPGSKYFGDIVTTTEWSRVELPLDVDADGLVGGTKIVLGFGQAITDITVDNVVLAKKVVDEGGTTTPDDEWEQVMIDGDFAESSKGTTFDVYNTYGSDSYSVGTEDGNNVLIVTNTTPGNNWEPQLAILLPSGTEFAAGENWQLKFKAKSLNSSTIDGVSFQVAAGGDALSGKYYSFPTTTDWQEFTLDIDVDAEGLATAGKVVLGLGLTADTFTIDDIQFLKKKSDGTDEPDEPDVTYEWGEELIANGDFETAVDIYETDNWLAQVNVQSSGDCFAMVEGVDGGQALKMNNIAVCTNKWETQFIIKPEIGEFKADDIFKLEFDIKSDNGSTITGSHSQTPSYGQAFVAGDITTKAGEWTHYCYIITNAAGGTNFAMQFGDIIDAIYFDNITFKKECSAPVGGHFEPLTPEEKKANITAAMQEWVTAMLSHTSGKVKVWDVVNEAIDDNNPSELRTNGGKTDNTNFYWQDFMGENYVRDVVKMAREAAGDEELLLFINDYGLEYEHNSNAKLDGLIAWIEKWESDGVTKIDGIGTQMHIALSLNSDYQLRQEAAVVAMLEKLKSTGKLIKISEIDMRISLGDNTYQKAADTTEEQHKLMSDYYKFIVSKYFEIIPKEQQYGITHWSPTDATEDEFAWCAGEPIGLWTTAYTRKHAYAGFVEGLKGN